MSKKIENKEVKEVIAKAVATKKATETKKEVVEKKQDVKNEVKKNVFLKIADVTAMYSEAGIKCFNPEGKGDYRIMGHKKGSSLNIKSTKGYYIYSTDSDFELIKAAKLDCKDLVVEEKTNSQDKSRPNTIICTTTDTLKALLKVYATNPENQVVVATAVEK